MALTFPISASIGDTYQSGSSNTYEWTGTYWKIKNVINFNAFSASIVDRIITATNEGQFATTGSNTFVGNQIVSGNIELEGGAQIIQNYQGTLGSIDLKAGPGIGSWAELQSNNSEQYIWVDNTAAYIATNYDAPGGSKQWMFDRSGSIHAPGNILISGSIIPNTAEGTYTSSFSLGSVTNAWKDLYISHGSIIFVDAVTQETSSFSITTDGGDANTVKYTAGITASYYLGDGANLTNLPSTTNWNKERIYTVRETEQLTFSGDYILENSYLQILSEGLNSIGDWTALNVDGDGTITRTGNNTYRIIGPNDQNSNGWLFIKRFFDTATTMVIPYVWTTQDGSNDWPMYQFSSEEPTGEIDNTNRLQGGDLNTSYESDTWIINVPANSWLAIGVYSNDSTAGAGTLDITLPYIVSNQIQYAPNKYFKKEGSIFIGGNLLVKDSDILNNGKISVGGEVILIGNSTITGTGTII